MGVKVNPGVTVAKSTGAVAFNDGYQQPVEQSANNASTGAVEYQAPGKTAVAHDPAKAVARVKAPEPIVLNQWPGGVADAKAVTEAQAKVVEPETAKRPAKKSSRAKTK